MISANEVKTITKYSLEKKNKATEDFCNDTLSQLIIDQAKKGGNFLKFDISKDIYSFQYLLAVKTDIKHTYYYDVPSVDIMWNILFDAGYVVDITTDETTGNSIWIVRWDNDSNKELEGSL